MNWLLFKDNLPCVFHHFKSLQINLIATGWLLAPLQNILKTIRLTPEKYRLAHKPKLKWGEHVIKMSPDKIPKDTHGTLQSRISQIKRDCFLRVELKSMSPPKKSSQWVCMTRLAIISIGTSWKTQAQMLQPLQSTTQNSPKYLIFSWDP